MHGMRLVLWSYLARQRTPSKNVTPSSMFPHNYWCRQCFGDSHTKIKKKKKKLGSNQRSTSSVSTQENKYRAAPVSHIRLLALFENLAHTSDTVKYHAPTTQSVVDAVIVGFSRDLPPPLRTNNIIKFQKDVPCTRGCVIRRFTHRRKKGGIRCVLLHVPCTTCRCNSAVRTNVEPDPTDPIG